MLEFSTVKRTATGRWPEVWQSLGVPADKLTGKHVSCLGCGGADRFRIVLHDADGRWFCGQGGSPTGGDGFNLLCHAFGWTKSAALHAVADHFGIKSDTSPAAKQRARNLAILAKARPLEEALAHELRVLLMVLEPRVLGREIAHIRRIKQSHPEHQAAPENRWQREEQAAMRIILLIRKIYPAKLLGEVA